MTISRTAMRKTGSYDGGQRNKLPVYDSGDGSGNDVLLMDHPMRELFFSNDSDVNNLTIVVSGDADLSLSFTLKPGETFDERLPEFLVVTVTAADAWRWFVRSGAVT